MGCGVDLKWLDLKIHFFLWGWAVLASLPTLVSNLYWSGCVSDVTRSGWFRGLGGFSTLPSDSDLTSDSFPAAGRIERFSPI